MPRPLPQTKKPAALPLGDQQRVWVLRDGEAIAVEIRIGVTDGRSSEVVDGGLEPGMQVITDLLAATP